MKKLFYTFGAALVMLASVSCQKKDSVSREEPVEKTQMIFTASASAEKTTVKEDGTTVVWSEGDAIKVFAANGTQGSVCEMTDPKWAGTNYAEFGGESATQGPWTAICPAFDGATCSAGIITFTMPETQTYKANSFADGAMPCVAYSNTTEFNFKHSFGVLKLSLKLDFPDGATPTTSHYTTLKSIKVTDKSEAKLNGTFTVNPQTSAVATYSTGGNTSITLDCSNVKLYAMQATDFWIVVPQGAFAAGFDVTITSAYDNEVTISTTKVNTITAGEIKEMPVQTINFVAATATGSADVSSSAGISGNKVNWVQLWAGGPKIAEFNIGAKSAGEYGGYYRWGMITDKDGSGKYYDGNEDIQGGEHDTAKNLWGTNWQMPKKTDLDPILDYTKMIKFYGDEKYKGSYGKMYVGEGDYTSVGVFFPAAGYYDGEVLNAAGSDGYWWCSTYYNNSNAWHFKIRTSSQSFNNNKRKYGYSVRAILAE